MSIKDYHVRLVCETPDPDTVYRTIQTDTDQDGNNDYDPTIECPAHPGGGTRHFTVEHEEPTVPSCSTAGLDITTTIGSIVDVYNGSNDPSNTKYFQVNVVTDDTSGAIEVEVETKTTGSYPGISPGKTLIQIVNEYSCPAGGSTLTEV